MGRTGDVHDFKNRTGQYFLSAYRSESWQNTKEEIKQLYQQALVGPGPKYAGGIIQKTIKNK